MFIFNTFVKEIISLKRYNKYLKTQNDLSKEEIDYALLEIDKLNDIISENDKLINYLKEQLKDKENIILKKNDKIIDLKLEIDRIILLRNII